MLPAIIGALAALILAGTAVAERDRPLLGCAMVMFMAFVALGLGEMRG